MTVRVLLLKEAVCVGGFGRKPLKIYLCVQRFTIVSRCLS